MSTPTAPEIWSIFTHLRDTAAARLRHFGELPVDAALHAGDGGTFACHVTERVKEGRWALYRLGTEDDVAATLAVRDGAMPVRWDVAGAIIIDSAMGAFVPAAALQEIKSLDDDDGDALTDAIDEAIFGADDDEAVLKTPEGRPFAVFQLGGDGTYDVHKGIDAQEAVCVLIVVEW